jgi:hypothetical protein
MFREIIAVYFEIHMKHTNIILWEECKVLPVEAGGTYDNHWASKG